VKIAFIIDPIDRLDPGHDTSIALMEAAQARGDQVWITEARHLSIVQSQAMALLWPASLTPVTLGDNRWVAVADWYRLGDPQLLPLETMDAVFMRTDPPVTIPYLYTTYILDYIDGAKTRVINAPQGLRAANEKMYALQFTEAIPETIVSREKPVIQQAVERWGAAVLKPLDGKGGEGILFLELRDRNFNSMVEISTRRGQLPVMVQQFLPAAKAGDKRIILLDGHPIGAVNRIPSGSEFRGNMAVGGRVAATEISEREHQICQQLAPTLRRDGLVFVGIDVIGGYLTEVNVTSPTGLREIDRLNQTRLGEQVLDWVATASPPA